jgi:hypothetical protein
MIPIFHEAYLFIQSKQSVANIHVEHAFMLMFCVHIYFHHVLYKSIYDIKYC